MVKPLGLFLFLTLAVLPAIVVGDTYYGTYNYIPSSDPSDEGTFGPDMFPTVKPSFDPTGTGADWFEDTDEPNYHEGTFGPEGQEGDWSVAPTLLDGAPPEVPRGLAYINCTLIFDLEDGRPPSQADIKGIVKATEEFYFYELNGYKEAHRQQTEIKMYSVKPRYEYETQEAYQSEWKPARFSLNFMVKIHKFGREDAKIFKEKCVETLQHANYTRYINEYVHSAESMVPKRCGGEGGLRCGGGPPESESQFRFTKRVNYNRERMISIDEES